MKKAAKKKARKVARSKRAVARTPPEDAPPATQAARFDRARRDHSNEIAEDYAELIAQLIAARGEARTVDIAKRLGVSHVTVTKTINRLQEQGLVRTELAQMAAERHELVVRFLCKLGVGLADAEMDAEGIEHHLSAATMRAIRSFVAGGG